MSRMLLFLSSTVLLAFVASSAMASPAGIVSASAIFGETTVESSGGYYARGAAVADVNGDGKPDLLVLNQCATSNCSSPASAVDVLLGNGDGSFQLPVAYPSGGSGADSIAVADVNGDGKPDLVVASQCASSATCTVGVVSVLLGNGDGTFRTAQTYSSGALYAVSVAIADVNSDGKLDLVVGHQCADNSCTNSVVSVMLGNGDGTFQPALVRGAIGVSAIFVVVADVNGDGKPDIVIANEQTDNTSIISNGAVSVLLGNGDGTFQPVVTYSSGGIIATSVVVADVNQDGRPDLVLSNQCVTGTNTCTLARGSVAVLLGNGDGSFQTAVAYDSVGDNPYSVAVTDVNGDGKPDLLVANECAAAGCGDGSVAVLLGRGDGTFLPANSTYDSGGTYAIFLAVKDLNRDGTPDLLVINQCAPGCTNSSFGVMLGNGDGTFNGANVYPSNGGSDSSIAVGDVNRDGKPDLLIANTSGTMSVLLGNGNGTFHTGVTYSSGGYQPQWLAISDVNGDGKIDVIVANNCVSSTNCANGTVAVLFGNGDGTFQTPVIYSSGGYYADSMILADVNGDGKLDVIVSNQCLTNTSCASGVVDVLLGNGNGTFQAAVGYGSGGEFAFSLAAVDVNRDGNLDLLVTNEYVGNGNLSNGTVGVLLGKGDGTFGIPVSYSSGGQYAYGLSVADLNADGKPDLLVTNQCPVAGSGCTNGIMGILLGNGDGTFQLPTTINTPQVTGTQQLVVADFDGDGKLDVASGAGDFLLLGNGDGTFQPALGLGASGAGIAVGDFNLDGKPDLAVGGVTILMNVSPAPVRSATATSLASSLNPSAYDQAVSFKAVVSTQAGGNPSGNVIFSDGGSTLGTATLVNGSASLSVTSFAVGSHSVTASYGGNASFIPSTSALTQIVNTAPTTTVGTESPSPAVFGQSIMITAQVTSSAGTPAGVITFLDGTTTIGTGSLNGNGQAAFNTSALGAGVHTISASYGANGNFSGSTSAAVSLTVNKSSTVTSIAEQTPNPSVAAQPVTVSFAVKASPPGSGTPTGSVMVNDGTGDSCTATVASAACTITFASAGPKTLAVSYAGDSNFSSSASTGITHNVKDFSISASPISQSVKAVQKVSYKVTLAPLNGFTGTMSLSCVGLPAGSICSFAPSSTSLTTSGSATSTITVQTSKTTPKGTYNLNLVGIYGSGSPASGGLTHGAKVTLIVQ